MQGDPAVPAIEVNALSKHFDRIFALNDLDLSVSKGQVCAVLGPNGAGKTTLIRCLLGLTKPDHGRMKVLGAAPGSIACRSRVGTLLQDAELPDLLSAKEHLALFASYYQDPLPVDQVLSSCDLNDFARQRYKKLSGGQKKRVQFALALVGRPELIFLDEPTAGMDIGARHGLWQIVRELASGGTTVILTTHFLEEAQYLADTVAIMQQGKVTLHAPTTTILGLVKGATVQCITTLTNTQLSSLRGVSEVRRKGRMIELTSSNPTITIKNLLEQDPSSCELNVIQPSLEEALRALN